MSDHVKIQEALDMLKQAAKDKKVELVEMLQDIYADVKKAEEKAVNRAKKAAHDVDESIHSNPWPYIGGAALAGLILGFWMRRK